MKNYRFKFTRSEWSKFSGLIIGFYIGAIILYFFLSVNLTYVLYQSGCLTILGYMVFGKYPYWIIRKKEVKT